MSSQESVVNAILVGAVVEEDLRLLRHLLLLHLLPVHRVQMARCVLLTTVVGRKSSTVKGATPEQLHQVHAWTLMEPDSAFGLANLTVTVSQPGTASSNSPIQHFQMVLPGTGASSLDTITLSS